MQACGTYQKWGRMRSHPRQNIPGSLHTEKHRDRYTLIYFQTIRQRGRFKCMMNRSQNTRKWNKIISLPWRNWNCIKRWVKKSMKKTVSSELKMLILIIWEMKLLVYEMRRKSWLIVRFISRMPMSTNFRNQSRIKTICNIKLTIYEKRIDWKKNW